MTREQILNATGEKLSKLAGEVLWQKSYKHKSVQTLAEMEMSSYHCSKCKEVDYDESDPCSCPDPIPITGPEAWNHAMKWRGWAVAEYGADEFINALYLSCVELGEARCYSEILTFAQPIHYIKAACLCKLGKE